MSYLEKRSQSNKYQFFNKILKTKHIPVEWKIVNITMLHNKKDTTDINYRFINLLSNMYKLFTRQMRLESILVENQSRGQASLGKVYLTVDQSTDTEK